MPNPEESKGAVFDRRALLAGGAGAVAAGLVASRAGAQEPGGSAAQAGTRDKRGLGKVVLETVTGPISGDEVDWALEHEHLFVDFDGAKDPSYQDVDWADVTGACANSVGELVAQGINLFVDYTPAGVGRNARLIRDVSRQTGMNMICSSGIYRASFGIPPEFQDLNANRLADHFVRELTLGTEGTSIRCGFIKIAVDDDGPKPADVTVYRAAARAANETGCTIGMHAPVVAALRAAVRVLERNGFDLNRFVWAHAEYGGTFAEYLEFARRGAYISLDAVTVGGVPGDQAVLDLIQQFIDEGILDKLLISTDSTIYVKPHSSQYGFQNTYLFRVFKPMLDQRFGEDVSRQILRDNVVTAYRRGDNVT
jgi:predicted metal-dependent phosphotriesterase family hydrolase